MPTYQYACTACGHQLEAVQSFTDDPLSQCPACEGQLRKLFGSVGIVFKGSGFYRNDSRAASNGNGANGDAPKTSETPKNGESKPADGATSKEKTSASSETSTAKKPAKATSPS